jgi:sugar phosphate isomerase/epimerase
MVTRRAFTGGVLGATAGLAFGGRAWAQDPLGKIKPSVVGGLKIGVQSYTYRKLTLEKMIDSMRAVGLSSVELWTGHLDPARHDEADFKTTREKLASAGITVNAYCVNFRPDVTPELLDKAFKGAGLLGTSLMTTSTEKSVVPKLDEWCAKYKVTIGLHNHYLGDEYMKGREALNFGGPADYAEALAGRSNRIAINLDIGHFSASGHDPVAYFKDNVDRIVSLHVKDRDKDAAHTYRRFGQGATPIVEVLKLARRLDYKYAANIEYEMDAEEPTEGVRDSFAYVKRALG